MPPCLKKKTKKTNKKCLNQHDATTRCAIALLLPRLNKNLIDRLLFASEGDYDLLVGGKPDSLHFSPLMASVCGAAALPAFALSSAASFFLLFLFQRSGRRLIKHAVAKRAAGFSHREGGVCGEMSCCFISVPVYLFK